MGGMMDFAWFYMLILKLTISHYQSGGAFSRVEWALRVNMISADQRIRAPISFLHLTRRNPFSIVDVEGIDLRKNVQWKPWFYPAIDQGIL